MINYHLVRAEVAANVLNIGKENGETNLVNFLTKVITDHKQ